MKSLWVILISVLVTGGLVGGGTYYFINLQSTKDKDALEAQVNGLNSKIADTEKLLADSLATAETAAVATSATASWKTYTSTNYGFSLKYPKDWTVSEPINNSIALRSATTNQWYTENANNSAVDGIANDITITFYNTISDADINADKSAKTIADLVNQTGSGRSGVTQTIFSGGTAYEYTIAGMTSSYEIMAGNNDHVYTIGSNAETKTNLTEIQKQIIASFSFNK